MDDVLFPTVGIAGIGLIGGSLAKDLRTFGLTNRLIGWNRTAAHAERALELGLVDDLAPSLEPPKIGKTGRRIAKRGWEVQ